MPETEGIYATRGVSFLEDIPLVEFMYLYLLTYQVALPQVIQAFVDVSFSLMSVINSLRLLTLHRHPQPHLVSDDNNSPRGYLVNVCTCVFIC